MSINKTITVNMDDFFTTMEKYEPYIEPVVEFSADQFLEELQRGSEALEAEYSEDITKAILSAYGDNFAKGVVQLHGTTSGEALIYRCYPPQPIDSIGIAVKAGLFDPKNPSVDLVRSWVDLYPEAYEMPDFACDTGLARAFIFFGVNAQGGLRPLDEILGAPGVPAYIREKRDFLMENGLAIVQAAHVDFRTQQVCRTLSSFFLSLGKCLEHGFTWLHLYISVHFSPPLLHLLKSGTTE